MLDQENATRWQFFQRDTGRVITVTLPVAFTGAIAMSDDDGGIYVAEPDDAASDGK